MCALYGIIYQAVKVRHLGMITVPFISGGVKLGI